MAKFICNRLARDKVSAGFIRHDRHLLGKELQQALLGKILEEAHEVAVAQDIPELTSELADVIEVIHGIAKAYGISMHEIENARITAFEKRGGFQTGAFAEMIEVPDDHPKLAHFRNNPDKYQEIIEK